MVSGDPLRLLETLKRHEVPFVIIGGHAVIVHGFVRTTEDLDIVIRRSVTSDSALFAALAELNALWISNEIDPATGMERTMPVTLAFVRSSRLMMLITDDGFLDVFDFLPGLPNEPVDGLFETAVEYGGYRYASLEWLRKLKQAADRAKDRIDLNNLPNPVNEERPE